MAITASIFESLVLVGRQTGVAVIPQATPLTRLNYFDGKFLRASDLKAEQDYLRQIAQQSNQAGGAGVAHGYDVTLGSGDTLEIGAGLAIDPQGRVLLLPRETAINIQKLIDDSRALQSFLSAGKVARDGSFEQCELTSATPPVNALASSNLFVITIAHAEALCGEEDVFGKLCEEACVTSTDRPFVVEGLVVRALPLVLRTPMPNSKAVPLTQLHLRSRVASAYFEDERQRVASLISKAGLEQMTWCLGADAEGGSGVPIGVLARDGAKTVFLDAWIARRERMDAPARRYWQWRMMMRPWDVFLAQVLQFQCQLHDLFKNTPAPGGPDPCGGAGAALKEAAETIAELKQFYEATTNRFTNLRVNLDEAITFRGGASRIETLNTRLLDIGAALAILPQDRLLIRGGIVELPSAGYLPVAPGGNLTINQQVRQMMGEGVDLRFCVVRPDYVAHALEEAQHMERISLLEGLDDPQRKPQVDILVPDGEIIEQKRLSPGRGFDADVAVLEDLLTRNDLRGVTDSVRVAQLSSKAYYRFSGAARADVLAVGGGAFYLGGVFEQSTVTGGLTAVPGDAFRANAEPGDVAAASAEQPARGLADDIRLAQAVLAPATRPGLWISLDCDENIFALERGDTANFSGRAIVAAASGASATRVLDVELKGELRITQENQRSAQGEQVVKGRCDDARLIFQGLAFPPPGKSTKLLVDLDVVIKLKSDGSIEISLSHGQNVIELTAAWGKQPLEVTAAISVRSQTGGSSTVTPLASARLKENADVLSVTNESHQEALAALAVVGRALGDPTFTDAKARLLFPTPPKPTDELIVRGTKDWVLFHRRRTKVCSEEKPAPPPLPKRRYIVWQVYDAGDANALRDMLLRTGSVPANRLNPARFFVEFGGGVATLVTTTDEILTVWRAASPGNALIYGAISTGGVVAADGEVLALNRLDRLIDTLAPVSPRHPQALDPNALANVNLPAEGADGVILLITLRQVANLTLTKTDTPDPVAPGATITYTLNFANTGQAAASNVAITDIVPANTTFVSAQATSGTGWAVSNPTVGGTGNVSFTKASVANSETATFQIVVRVSTTVTGSTIINTATATGAGTNTATATTTTAINAAVDLALDKTDTPDPVTVGNNITYLINFFSTGPGVANNATVTDSIPANTTFVSAEVVSGADWTKTDPVPGAPATVRFTKASVASGERATFRVVVRVNTSAANGATITNEATANAGGQTVTARATTQVSAVADLALTKTDSPTDQVFAGQNITYTVNFINNGPSAASNVTLTDSVPANTTFVSAAVTSGDGWTPTLPAPGGTGDVRFAKASVASGERASFQIVVRVNNNATGTISNTAMAATTTTDPNPGNNSATATTSVIQQPASADLGITKLSSPVSVPSGSNVTYTLRVTNNGPSNATGVSVTDTLPDQTNFISATVSTGTFTTNGRVVTWTIGNLAATATATATMTIVVLVGPNTPGGTTLVNRATVTSATTDPNNANNNATATTTVIAQVTRTALVIWSPVDDNIHFPPQGGKRDTVQFIDNVPQGNNLRRLLDSLTANEDVKAVLLASVNTPPDDNAARRAEAVARAVRNDVQSRTGRLSDRDKEGLARIGMRLDEIDEVIYLEPQILL